MLQVDAKGVLEGTTVLSWLLAQHPGTYELGQLRTVQRRLREWRAVHGPVHDKDRVPPYSAIDDPEHHPEEPIQDWRSAR